MYVGTLIVENHMELTLHYIPILNKNIMEYNQMAQLDLKLNLLEVEKVDQSLMKKQI